MTAVAMDCVGVQTSAYKKTPYSDLGEWRSIYSAGIDNATVLDIFIQSAAQSAPFHGGFYYFGYLRDNDSCPGRMHGRDGNPRTKRPQPQLGWRR